MDDCFIPYSLLCKNSLWKIQYFSKRIGCASDFFSPQFTFIIFYAVSTKKTKERVAFVDMVLFVLFSLLESCKAISLWD